MLKAQTALVTGHFSSQLGYGGSLPPLPLPPLQARMYSTYEDVPYKSGTSIFSTNKDVQYKQGISSVQLRICSLSKLFISTNEDVQYKQGTSSNFEKAGH